MENPADVEHFKQHFLKLKHKDAVTNVEYLAFCKEACVLAKKYIDIRSSIAVRVTSVALIRHNDLSPVVVSIADLFADLEVPDSHVYLEEDQTVDLLWQELEEAVDRQLAKLVQVTSYQDHNE